MIEYNKLGLALKQGRCYRYRDHVYNILKYAKKWGLYKQAIQDKEKAEETEALKRSNTARQVPAAEENKDNEEDDE